MSLRSCFAFALALALGGSLLTACGSPPGDARDAGALVDARHDGGGVIDVGPPGDGGHDAAVVDAFVPMPDGGGCSSAPATGDCVLYVPVGAFGPLTDACLPRCSAETARAYRACTTQACRSDAVRTDTTPGTSYYIGSAHVSSPMTCQSCVSYQEFHCFSLVCPSEVNTYVDECIAGPGDFNCDIAISNLDNCLALLTPDQEAMTTACYASHDGPEGCFPCE